MTVRHRARHPCRPCARPAAAVAAAPLLAAHPLSAAHRLPARGAGDEVLGAEVYSLSLYLCAHFYLREAHKADASDVWPPDLLPWQAEPSSPLRMTAHSWGREQHGGHSHKAYLPSMRQHLQQHLQHQEALLSGFSGFVARHADVLLALVTAPGAPSPGKQPQAQGMVSAAELDRLSFLLKPREAEAGEGPAAAGPSSSSGSGGSGGGGRRKRRLPEGGSPMDVCPTPFTGTAACRAASYCCRRTAAGVLLSASRRCAAGVPQVAAHAVAQLGLPVPLATLTLPAPAPAAASPCRRWCAHQ